MFIKTLFSFIVFMSLSNFAWAHSPISADIQEQLSSLFSLAVIAFITLVYLRGAKITVPSKRHLYLFFITIFICVFSTIGPLDEWAETNEAAHMTQHMLFMTVIAPLFVLSRPLPQLINGSRFMKGDLLWKPFALLTQWPMTAAYIHGFAIWFWHIPYFYVLALDHPWWHVFEHACFLITAGIFWWAVINSSRARTPTALLALLFTLMHTGFLGAFLTFSSTPFYGEDRILTHQQLAGLIMWVAGGIPYLIASIYIARRWYKQISS